MIPENNFPLLMATELSATPQSGPPHGKGYEPRDASAKWLFILVGALAIAGILTHLLIAWWDFQLRKKPPPTDAWTGSRRVEQETLRPKNFPRLQLSPPEDLQKYRAAEDARLNSYGWVNRTGGVVRIPVERALELVLERGLPTRDGTNPIRLGPSPLELQQQRTNYTEPKIVQPR